MTTHTQILNILADGKPCAVWELRLALKDLGVSISMTTATKYVRELADSGAIVASPGHSHRPKHGHVSRRFVLAREVAAWEKKPDRIVSQLAAIVGKKGKKNKERAA